MVGRIFIFGHDRGRKLGLCNWNEVHELYEKGERADHSRLTNINYLTNRIQQPLKADTLYRRLKYFGWLFVPLILD